MIVPHTYQDQKVFVLGLGKSGLSAIKALLKAGASVYAWDDNPKARKALKRLKAIETDPERAEWQEIDCLVLSPGIPHKFPNPHVAAELARQYHCPIICDVELLVQSQPDAQYVAVTGTNGKSTTSALIHHVLKSCGVKVRLGGNIGIPVMDLSPLGHDGVYVLEMSSYQLERTPSLAADVAILLNISPDHIDRHGTMAGYVKAKKNIFANQRNEHYAIIGFDDAYCCTILDEQQQSLSRKIPISAKGPVEDGIFATKTHLYDEFFSPGQTEIMDLSRVPTLPGEHNRQNACAAYACAMALDLDAKKVSKAIATFPGLAHRQERIAEKDGIVFVNDSKATNADACAKALDSYSKIYWIAGGVAKEGGIEKLVANAGSVQKAFLIGEAGAAFAQTLEGKIPAQICKTLDKAVQEAFKAAQQEPGVILLSPACASFDQFANFEARGNAFRKLVNDLLAKGAQT